MIWELFKIGDIERNLSIDQVKKKNFDFDARLYLCVFRGKTVYKLKSAYWDKLSQLKKIKKN